MGSVPACLLPRPSPVRATPGVLHAAFGTQVVQVAFVTVRALCTARADVTRTYHGDGTCCGLGEVWRIYRCIAIPFVDLT